MIRRIYNPNRPVYSEEEWEAIWQEGSGRHDRLIKCVHRETKEVFYFELSEVCGF